MLLEIIETFDLGDNFGRENLNELLHFALQSRFGYDQIYEKTIRLWEHLLPDENARMKFIADIVREQTSEKRYLVDWERSEIRSFIVCIQSPEAFYHINQLAMHIRKLHNDYRIECDIGMHTNAENKYKMLLQKDGELIALLKRVAKSPAQIRNAEPSTLEFVNKLTAKTGIDYDVVAQSLQKCYYVICSPNTTNINAPMLSLYKVKMSTILNVNVIFPLIKATEFAGHHLSSKWLEKYGRTLLGIEMQHRIRSDLSADGGRSVPSADQTVYRASTLLHLVLGCDGYLRTICLIQNRYIQSQRSRELSIGAKAGATT